MENNKNLILAKLPINYYDKSHSNSFIEQLIRTSEPESTLIYLNSYESESCDDGFIMKSIQMSNFKYNKIKLLNIHLNLELKTINPNCDVISFRFYNSSFTKNVTINLDHGYYNLSTYRNHLQLKMNAIPDLNLYFTPLVSGNYFDIEIIDNIKLKIITAMHIGAEPINFNFMNCTNLRCKKLCHFPINKNFTSNSFINSDRAFMIYTEYLTIESRELCKNQRNPNIINSNVNYNLISMIMIDSNSLAPINSNLELLNSSAQKKLIN